MKKLTPFILLFVSVSIYSQDGFFKNQYGMSFNYLQSLNLHPHPLYGAAYGAFFKSGLTIGLGVQTINEEYLPVIGFGYNMYENDNTSNLIPGMGFSFGFSREYTIGSVSFGLLKLFYPNTGFPFELYGSFSFEVLIGKGNNDSFDFLPVAGFGYTQAFFADKKLFPVMGIAGTFDINDSNLLFSGTVGLCLRI